MRRFLSILSITVLCLFVLASCGSDPGGSDPENCAHEWGSGKITKISSCEEEGELTYTCSLCNSTRTEALAALGHDYRNSSVIPASCDEDGALIHTCAVCGGTESEPIAALGHEYRTDTLVPASCTENGYAIKTCTVCSESATDVLESPGHTLGAATVISRATCQKAGEESAVCALCSETVITAIPIKDHDFRGSTTSDSVAATCNKPGIKVRKCLYCNETKGEETPATGRHSYSTDFEDYYVKTAPTAEADGARVVCCDNCAAEKTVAYTYAEYMSDLETARNKLLAVDTSAFGALSISQMSTTAYAKPAAAPTVGEHPRLLINSSVLEDLRAAILLDENVAWFNEIVTTSNSYNSGLLGEMVVHDKSGSYGPKGEHNFNENIYDCVMAKSFLYLLTGIETYAYDAVRIMKEYISTMKMKNETVSPDPERNWGYAMFTAALVYDWCYGAMSEQDKEDMIRGVEYCVLKTKSTYGTYSNNMEIGFPPSLQGAVGSHGSERQLLRDYLSFALAIYDEVPSWYEFIGGRFYQEYVPVRNEFYKAGMYPQGISVYVQIRYTSDLWSAWLMKSATGVNPYSEMMAEVIPSLFCRVVDGGYSIFAEGDDEGKSGEEILKGLSLAASISAYLFDDTRAASWAKYLDYPYTSSLYLLILRSTGVDETNDRYADLDLIRYNAGFLGEVIAHSDWTANAASVLMKIGGRSTANHDHADAGSFQIYYKGILAGDTGFYDSYGSTHHRDYHQATIAHNSIVIYRNGKVVQQTLLRDEPGTFANWMTSKYHTATVTGYSEAYKDAEKNTPIYSYIAGDLTPAYSGNFTRADRRMLVVFDTGNPDVPMFFFVYDGMQAKNTTDDITFLLHTGIKPEINGNVVTTSMGGGKLVLQSLMGGDKITAIGGTDNNYVVNGTQIPTLEGEKDGYWGRVEITSTSSSVSDTLLNVMYVTDNSNKSFVEAKSFKTSKVVGSIIGSTAAVFVDSSERCSEEFSFTATDSGESISYYVSGVAAGNWTVTAGATTLTVTAPEEGGMLYFTAPAGEITLTPVK